MNQSDIERVQTYLRRLLGSDRISLLRPAKPGLSVEVTVDDEVIGTAYKDTDEGETSYSLTLTILEEDLPPAPKTATPAGATRRSR
ncbi:MAG: DUF3126 family protein [Rhodospirillales bacterium]|nr:DUF3126 family protein [Rhodospirillales bacterium]MBN8905795.1 DUF3126 family protein [Rhodospirillales bacterium]